MIEIKEIENNKIILNKAFYLQELFKKCQEIGQKNWQKKGYKLLECFKNLDILYMVKNSSN